MPPTKSQTNFGDLSNFVSLHSTPYPDIDPSQTKLPQPYVVCIIGGRGSVGSSLARSYAQAGATGIVLGARSISLLEEVAHEVAAISPSTKTIIHECDIASSESVAALAARTASEFHSHLDLVVVNAGYAGPVVTDIVKEPPEQFQRAFDVNTIGTYHAAHHFLPLLLGTPRGGKSFLAISSLGAATVSGPLAHVRYCVSKAAQTRVVEVVHEQYAERGLFCATLHPGAMKSELSSVMPQEHRGSELLFLFCYFDARWQAGKQANR